MFDVCEAGHRIFATARAPKLHRRRDKRLYQLKISLKGSKRPIWRRVVVRADTTLDRLHDVIQAAMGWEDVHLHQFISVSEFGVRYFDPQGPESSFIFADVEKESDYTVADIAPAVKTRFVYEYDFGDSWEHVVVVEKILPPDPEFKRPICLAGAKACPPEYSGGIYGYYEMLEAASNPAHPYHEQTKEWLGEDFDPEDFSVEYVNVLLNNITA